MKNYALTAAALALTAGAAHAGGLDRSGTSVNIIFEEGNYAEISLGFADPKLTGRDNIGTAISNVSGDFFLLGAGLKMDINEKLSFALIFDQPYGADVSYGPASTVLGGTLADAESNAVTALARFKFNDNISIFAGPRFLQAKGNIRLQGTAYNPPITTAPLGIGAGYRVDFASDEGIGAVIGAAYEKPEIALRVAVVYHSAIDLKFNTTETFPFPLPLPAPANTPIASGKTKSELPQTLKISVQSGVAKDTLVFGSFRWSEWSAFSLTPTLLAANLAQLDDTYTYELGVGRRFSDKFSARISVLYETGGSDNIVSPLAPSNGQKAISIGGKYKISDSIDLSAGIRYTWLGNARPETGADVIAGSFRNNTAISAGVKLGIHF